MGAAASALLLVPAAPASAHPQAPPPACADHPKANGIAAWPLRHPTPLATATERQRGLAVVAAAKSCLGTPYSWAGGNVHGPTLGHCDGKNGYLNGVCQADHTVGFDCSGLTLYAWYQASGGTITLPHRSPRQHDHGRHLTQSELIPGDLLFFADPGGPIHHVGIYLGNGAMIHAEHTGTVVHILNDVFHDPKWGHRYVGATRPTP